MFGEGRRILVGNLKAKPAGFFKISPELLRSSAFSLPMIVTLINSRSMKFLNDRVKVIVSHCESEVAASISCFCDFAELIDLIEDNALTRRNADNGHAVFLFDQIEIQKVVVEIHAGIQIGGVEMEMVKSRFADSLGFSDLEKVSL